MKIEQFIIINIYNILFIPLNNILDSFTICSIHNDPIIWIQLCPHPFSLVISAHSILLLAWDR